ncbi:MAG: serine hydrolase, partial [Flavobacteriales bacterium]|nr:serine hydrolase [Flavobacteriales bacterium]
MMRVYLFMILISSLLSFRCVSGVIQDTVKPSVKDSAAGGDEIIDPTIFDMSESAWVDSVMQTLTSDQRIAQLFMVAAYSNKDQTHVDAILKLVEEQKIGGLIFFQGGPIRQAKLTNLYQSKSDVPLLLSIDAEWGLAMRLDSTVKYPRQMMLGAIQNDALIYKMGEDIAEQCKRLGIHVNLAPVIDVNNNSKNPVINSRSFGEDKVNVANKGVAYMKGMQDHHVMANAKHFPGHGDTDSDSHKSLPIISHDLARLTDIELYPFRHLIESGIASMMIAHLYIPALDSTPNQASTLSKPIVTGLLKEKMCFEGLIFTDALNMKGVSAYFEPGVVDVKALLAGNDVLLFSEDVPTAMKEIKKAIEAGQITQSEIDARCRKILIAKQWVGLNEYKPVELKNLYEDLNKPEYYSHNRKLYENAMTILKNDGSLLPLKKIDSLKIASLAIGDIKVNTFQKALSRYADVKHFNVPSNPTDDQIFNALSSLNDFDLVIVSVHRTNERPSKNFGVTTQAIKLVNTLQQKKTVVLDVFANPYCLAKFHGAENVDALIVSYHDRAFAEEASASLIFGGIKATGHLPITASEHFKLHDGLETSEVIRLRYGSPEDVGMSTESLAQIDKICKSGIADKAFPGCQVVVLKEGSVIYQKSFGHHTYEKKREVKNDDIYDIASITKIASTTLSLMYLQDQGKLDLDYSLCDYIPEMVDTTVYQNMVLRDMLSHQAGLVSWIPFYKATLIKGMPRFDIYSQAQSNLYSNRIAEDFYIKSEYSDVIIRRILGTSLKTPGRYKYSDLGYYLFQKVIEKETQLPLDSFVSKTFYEPMGLTTMGYKPRTRFGLDRITPTEYDMLFRKQLVHGDVHDPGASMLGGVGGHAGVFSSAGDLAKLMQMYVNGGTYGGKRYISEATLKEFTDCQNCTGKEGENRRGAGFDKPVRVGTGGPHANVFL